MSLGNLPVIKTLVSRSKRGHRVELNPEMISPPLGDFRHIMHVGRKGEVFGDTSFLSKFQEKRRHNRWDYITKKLRQAGRMSSDRSSLREKLDLPLFPPPPISPIIKNAVSLPQLSNRRWNDEKDKEDTWNCLSEMNSPYGLDSGFCTLPRLSCSDERSEETNSQKPEEDWTSIGLPDTEDCSICTVPLELSSSLWRSDSMQSFIMDLGPSLMSEVMEGMSFSGVQENGAQSSSDPQEQSPVLTNTYPSSLSAISGNTKWEPSQLQSDSQQPKSFASWEPATITEEMEVDTEEDSGITESEQSSRCVTTELWDSGDGSEIEM
ncbi:cdc42 effector protein 1 [Rhinophrynus dorsalis]